VTVPVDSAQVIEIGDLVYLATDDLRAADEISAGSLRNMQDAFVDDFIGVAMQRSISGETAVVRVATTGTFEFLCASGTWTISDKVAVAGTGGVALVNQTVIAPVGANAEMASVGKVSKTYATAVTAVLVEIKTNVFQGGIPAATASS
jgi:hypothetical protein